MGWSVEAQPLPPPGRVAAVDVLLERVLPGSGRHFSLTIVETCTGNVIAPCYQLADEGEHVAIAATGGALQQGHAGAGLAGGQEIATGVTFTNTHIKT